MRRVALVALAISGVARGDAREVLARFDGEPTVRQLQLAAAREAEVHPERVRSWLERVRHAALLPTLKVRVGRGVGALEVIRGADGIDRLSTTSSDAWRFEVEADWALDRLWFDRNELRLSREAQRVATRREQLLTEVARLYFARRRLQVEAQLEPGDEARAAARALEIDELTAVLDGLTGGALSRVRR